MTSFRKTLVAAATALASLTAAVPALADITVGISLPLTGPASGLGIPMANFFKLFPASIAGEKLNIISLDDATDPTKGVQNAKRFVTEDKVDIIIGSAATPVAGPMAAVAAESGTVQLAASPVGLPPGGDAWTFRLPQSNDVMAHAMVGLMKKQGIKTIGFLGYTDAYGELWLKAITAEAEKNGIKNRGHRALRPCRHQRHCPGAEAHRRQPRCDAGGGLGLGRGHAAQGHRRARLQGQDLPDPCRCHDGPDACGRQGCGGRLRRLRPGHGG